MGTDSIERGLQTGFASVIGSFLLITGILSFINDPLFGMFDTNGTIAGIHIISGALLIAAGVWGGTALSRLTNRIIGGFFIVVAVFGYVEVIASLATNWPMTVMHGGIGILSCIIGLIKRA